MKTVITGANGHLGLQLIGRLFEAGHEVMALVRSERAAATVRKAHPDADVQIVDYRSAPSLKAAAGDCDVLIHLVGIIKESRANTFRMAHEDVSQAIVDAGIAAGQLITLGIVGTGQPHGNRCFESRAEAERILMTGTSPVTVIRVPMVIGPEDYASRSLAANGRKRFVMSFRPESLEQPIDAQDVVNAVMAAVALGPDAAHRTLELAGPESLSRRALIGRAGQVFGNSPTVIGLPFVLGYLLAGIFERVSANPPVTRAMLGVLDHDDRIDVKPACDVLGLQLTPLDETLGRILPNL